MKNFPLFILTILSTVAFSQRRPLIPDLIAEVEKIPVVTDYRYITNLLQYESGVYLYSGNTYSDGRHRHLENIVLKEESIKIALKIVSELNKAFDTNKFFYLPQDELEEEPPFFVSSLMNIDYTFEAYSKYKINAISYLSFYYFGPKYKRVVFTGPWGTGRTLLVNIPDVANVQKEKSISLVELVSEHPYEPYLDLISDGIEPGMIKVKERIMKQYNKKKKKK